MSKFLSTNYLLYELTNGIEGGNSKNKLKEDVKSSYDSKAESYISKVNRQIMDKVINGNDQATKAKTFTDLINSTTVGDINILDVIKELPLQNTNTTNGNISIKVKSNFLLIKPGSNYAKAIQLATLLAGFPIQDSKVDKMTIKSACDGKLYNDSLNGVNQLKKYNGLAEKYASKNDLENIKTMIEQKINEQDLKDFETYFGNFIANLAGEVNRELLLRGAKYDINPITKELIFNAFGNTSYMNLQTGEVYVIEKGLTIPFPITFTFNKSGSANNEGPTKDMPNIYDKNNAENYKRMIVFMAFINKNISQAGDISKVIKDKNRQPFDIDENGNLIFEDAITTEYFDGEGDRKNTIVNSKRSLDNKLAGQNNLSNQLKDFLNKYFEKRYYSEQSNTKSYKKTREY